MASHVREFYKIVMHHKVVHDIYCRIVGCPTNTVGAYREITTIMHTIDQRLVSLFSAVVAEPSTAAVTFLFIISTASVTVKMKSCILFINC